MVRPAAKSKPTAVVEKKTTVAKTSGRKSTAAAVKVEVKKTTAPKRKAASAASEEDDFDSDSPASSEDEAEKPAAKKRKTAPTAKKAEGSMPLAARTAVASLPRAMYIGAHVSGAGGVQNSIINAAQIGANAFAVFLKSQRKWTSPPLAADAKSQFLSLSEQHNYDAAKFVLPHGSYLVNLAQADETKAAQAYDNFIDDLQRCEALGIGLYNFHPGSTGGDTMAAACGRIAAQLNRSHKATKSVVTLIENMCGSGNIVGSRFEELRDIIAAVDDKSRVGVCIDTCHAFAAGYDLRSPEAFSETMAEFDAIVGMQYLRAFHLNDSKAPFGSHRDLHANIGTGFLGLRAFHNIMNHEPFQNLPMVLETPIDEKGPDGKSVENKQIWADEIKLLEGLIGQNAKSEEFQAQELELQARGADERKKIQDQVDKKVGKDAKKGATGGVKKKAKAKDHECDHGDDSD
ncbi:xylose isomerase-like protein [Lasiosphaeris hirsuta]|uniref:Apurinic-apyrimidinic endonuclease 1 n=1 Tax=Lasiosphaeris hirsuta TaxID=260670 RepID=A0AA40BCA7_9PEZI|nr:xylose isomerase-like protein [Lasiosphaeris hirsuta]